MMEQLAADGGIPVRTEPWPRWPHFTDREIEAVSVVLKSGKVNYWTGDCGTRFERLYAEYLDVPHAIAVMNGTVALELGLRALGVGPGDEVIVPCRTFIASAGAVANVGATPVLADVEVATQNISARTIRNVLTDATRAVVAVHLAGMPCEMDDILEVCRERELFLAEDCAQAHGARYRGKPVGSFGDVAAFSFCQDKIISTGGEGGLLAVRHPGVYDRAVRYKDHGTSPELVAREAARGSRCFSYIHDSFGSNFRMTEIQALLGIMQLERLGDSVEVRRGNSLRLFEGLGGLPGIEIEVEPEWAYHSRYKAYVRVDASMFVEGWSRDRIVDCVWAEGIPVGSGACPDLGMEPAFKLSGSSRPGASELGSSTIMFEVHPRVTASCIDDAVAAVAKVMSWATGREA